MCGTNIRSFSSTPCPNPIACPNSCIAVCKIVELFMILVEFGLGRPISIVTFFIVEAIMLGNLHIPSNFIPTFVQTITISALLAVSVYTLTDRRGNVVELNNINAQQYIDEEKYAFDDMLQGVIDEINTGSISLPNMDEEEAAAA